MKKDCKFCRYVWNLLIALDQFCNAILAGDPDETMSSRFGKWSVLQTRTKEDGIKRSVADAICWFLNKLETDHCKKSIEEDEGADDVLL
jgi:hypothetical protein